MAHTKETFQDAISYKWILSPDEIRCLSKHFLVYWSASYFNNQIHDPVCDKLGYINKDGIDFKVVFRDADYRTCLSDPTAQVALSFRAPVDASIHPVVLVDCTQSKKGRS